MPCPSHSTPILAARPAEPSSTFAPTRRATPSRRVTIPARSIAIRALLAARRARPRARTRRSARTPARPRRKRPKRRFGVRREHPFVNPAGLSLSVTVTVHLMALGESWPGFGIDGFAPVRTWCFRPGSAEVPVTGRGAGSLCSMPDCGDLGRCSGNHLREPSCRPSQASRRISVHRFRRSGA
jgi:hypothetical protein